MTPCWGITKFTCTFRGETQNLGYKHFSIVDEVSPHSIVRVIVAESEISLHVECTWRCVRRDGPILLALEEQPVHWQAKGCGWGCDRWVVTTWWNSSAQLDRTLHTRQKQVWSLKCWILILVQLDYSGWPLGQTNSCIVVGGLLTQVQTHAMEKLWLLGRIKVTR